MKRWPPLIIYLVTAMTLMAAGVLCLYESPTAQGKTHHELVFGFNLISSRAVRQVDRPLELMRRPTKENPGAIAWDKAARAGAVVTLVMGGADSSSPWVTAGWDIRERFRPEALPVVSCRVAQVSASGGIGVLPALFGRMGHEPADPAARLA
jgi:hypothetical protein